MEASKTTTAEKRKTVTYKDIASTVSNDSRLHFLMELIPKPVPVAEAIEYQRRHRAEMGEAADMVLDEEGLEIDGSPELSNDGNPPQGTTFE